MKVGTNYLLQAARAVELLPPTCDDTIVVEARALRYPLVLIDPAEPELGWRENFVGSTGTDEIC